MADMLRNGSAHYTVYSGDTLSAALEQARRAPAVDVVIVPNGPEVSRVQEIAANDYRLTGVPVLVTLAGGKSAADLKLQIGSMKGLCRDRCRR